MQYPAKRAYLYIWPALDGHGTYGLPEDRIYNYMDKYIVIFNRHNTFIVDT
jgi:hypothetical protein